MRDYTLKTFLFYVVVRIIIEKTVIATIYIEPRMIAIFASLFAFRATCELGSILTAFLAQENPYHPKQYTSKNIKIPGS